MTAITNELMYEVLKQIQATNSDINATLANCSQQIIGIREDLNNFSRARTYNDSKAR